MAQPGQPVRPITLGRRELAECLADELRRLDPDEIYEETLTMGLARLDGTTKKNTPPRSRRGKDPS